MLFRVGFLMCTLGAALTTTTLSADPEYPPSLVAPTEPLPAEEQAKMFHLPPGFSIELIASEPTIHKPMNLNFDSRGRLYVTHSLEYPFPPAEGVKPRDALTVLSDLDRDGRFEDARTLVEGLNIPIGVTPTADGWLYYSIPRIYKAFDRDHDGQVESTEEMYAEFGFRDTHGMASSFTRWIDGWIYACHGFSNESQVVGRDGNTIRMQSGNTFRMRADGSHVEQVTHGQVNPFGLAFDPLGNMYSADCHTLPIYQLLRGAWYPSFGKPHDGLGYGPTMIGHDHGSTGICGVVYYAAENFPEEYRGTVFIGNPVTGRINHDRLAPHGTTFQAIELPDFLSCDDPWFRPVDIKLGPDGALYIADFYNCIIGHYEVPLQHPRRDRERGRLWRVTYRDPQGPTASESLVPDLAALTTADLVERLADANLTVRVLATEELAARPAAEVLSSLATFATRSDLPAHALVHAIWLRERLEPAGVAEDHLLASLKHSDRQVRVHTVKLLAERPEWTEPLAAAVRKRIEDREPFVIRAAADALGRHPAIENVPLLMSSWEQAPPDDTHLIHVIRMALRDHLRHPGLLVQVAAGVTSDPAREARIAELCLGVGDAASGQFLAGYLERRTPGGENLPLLVHAAIRHIADDQLPQAWSAATHCLATVNAPRREILRACQRAASERGIELPDEIRSLAHNEATRLLATANGGEIQAGLELARELRLASVQGAMAGLATNGKQAVEIRTAAIDACMTVAPQESFAVVSQLLANAGEPLVLRQRAATSLAAANQAGTAELLLVELQRAPERLAVEIAGALAGRQETGELLLTDVAAGKASARLLQETVVRERLASAQLPDLEARLAALTADLPAADLRLVELVAARRATFDAAAHDPAAGQKVFQKHCASCHRLNGQGAKIGPDLDGVGARGPERLMEDTLDPSRNVDQAFRSTVLQTTGGLVVSGLLLREEGQVAVLADAQGKEVLVPLAEIDERGTTRLSPMPANVADLVPEGEFADLIAFLLEQKQAPVKE